MKNTVLWGALFTLVCAQTQADTNTQSAPQAQTAGAATTPTPTIQPAAQGSQTNVPAQTQPVAQPNSATVINCEYKIPASTKTIDTSVVLNWSEKATAQAFNFNSTTLDDQMKKLQNCFTEQGWTGFNSALEKSGNLEAIKNQHLTVSSQIDGQATMDEVKDNLWKMTLPLQVVYQNDKEKVTQVLDIKLTVGRKMTGDLGITQMIATPRTAPNAPTMAPATTAAPATPPAAMTNPANNTSTQPATAGPSGTPTGASAPTISNPEIKPATTTPAP